jgi:hypothetical protein
MPDPTWQALYRAALVEPDPVKLHARIEAARRSIRERLGQIEDSDTRERQQLRQQLNDALGALFTLVARKRSAEVWRTSTGEIGYPSPKSPIPSGSLATPPRKIRDPTLTLVLWTCSFRRLDIRITFGSFKAFPIRIHNVMPRSTAARTRRILSSSVSPCFAIWNPPIPMAEIHSPVLPWGR